jgi:signal transduction histidine kinase
MSAEGPKPFRHRLSVTLPGAAQGATARRLLWPGGLSARLLVITVIFVLVAELLILAPSLATFEERWLSDRITRAELVIEAYNAAGEDLVSPTRRRNLQDRAGVIGLSYEKDGIKGAYFQPAVMNTPYVIDLRRSNVITWLAAPVRTLTSKPGSNVRVFGHTKGYAGANYLEIVAPDAPLKEELISYVLRLLWLTLLISVGTGALVYLSLNVFLVRPMQRITLAMERFRADPEDPSAHIEPSGRRDEVGRAEIELNRMQAEVSAALASRSRLAALGEAVAKINHDLRNMLTSAQLASERISMSADPSVASALPRLERALDRAARLTTEVLAYGKSAEPTPAPVMVGLKEVVEAAAEDAGLARNGVKLTTNLKPKDRVRADPDHLHRMLLNLLKNARQAVSGPDRRIPGSIRLTLKQTEDESIITVTDDGPGVPQKAQENLFQPFAGSARPGGTGLGLAIARELAQAQGGDLSLKRTGPAGSVFEITLPASVEAEVPAQA